MTIEELVRKRNGNIKRYRTYHGGHYIPGGEVTWSVEHVNGYDTLSHYGVLLAFAAEGEVFLSDYSLSNDLSVSDRNGIDIFRSVHATAGV